MTMFVAADAHTLTVQLFQSGPEPIPTYANNVMNGVAVGQPLQVDWHINVDGPAPINLTLDPTLPSGVYFARLQSSRPDGLRAVHRAPGRAPAPRRRDHADEHLAGLQLLRRRRRRLRRQLVRLVGDRRGRHHASASRPRRAVQVPELRPLVPALDVAHRQAGRLLRGRGSRGVPRRRHAARELRPGHLPGARGVRRGARLRRGAALPRSRREPDVPVGEQLLPPRRPQRIRA